MSRERNTFDYHALAEFRYQIRRYISYAQRTARAVGVDPQQHQLLLSIRGLPPQLKPTIRTLAERLQIRHHSAVELIDRSAERGLVQRQRDSADRREVSIHLTAKGEKLVAEIAMQNRDELRSAGRELVRVLRSLTADKPRRHSPSAKRPAARSQGKKGEQAS